MTVVLRHGQVAHAGVYGCLDIERETPLALDSLFRMYSQTKPVVAALTMQLQEDGIFFVDHPITNWLPEFEGRQVAAPLSSSQHVRGVPLQLGATEPMQRPITIRDLLTMTSGLPSIGNTPSALWPLLAQVWGGSDFDPSNIGAPDPDRVHEDMVIACAQLPNARQPGAGWEYGFDFDVLTVLLERATGQSLDTLLQERIFAPLGIEDCGFYCPPSQADRLVTNHHWGPDGSLIPQERPEDSEKVRESLGRQVSGNGLFGGVLMTPAGYTRFAQMLLNGGELDGQRILGRKTIELMTANHIGDWDIDLAVGPGYGFGFGYATLKTIGKGALPGSPGTYGWGGAAGTIVLRRPRRRPGRALLHPRLPLPVQPHGRPLRSLREAHLRGPRVAPPAHGLAGAFRALTERGPLPLPILVRHGRQRTTTAPPRRACESDDEPKSRLP